MWTTGLQYVICQYPRNRKNNKAASALYESLGFIIVDEDEQDYYRELQIESEEYAK